VPILKCTKVDGSQEKKKNFSFVMVRIGGLYNEQVSICKRRFIFFAYLSSGHAVSTLSVSELPLMYDQRNLAATFSKSNF
jgi:hypothetical protein